MLIVLERHCLICIFWIFSFVYVAQEAVPDSTKNFLLLGKAGQRDVNAKITVKEGKVSVKNRADGTSGSKADAAGGASKSASPSSQNKPQAKIKSGGVNVDVIRINHKDIIGPAQIGTGKDGAKLSSEDNTLMSPSNVLYPGTAGDGVSVLLTGAGKGGTNLDINTLMKSAGGGNSMSDFARNGFGMSQEMNKQVEKETNSEINSMVDAVPKINSGSSSGNPSAASVFENIDQKAQDEANGKDPNPVTPMSGVNAMLQHGGMLNQLHSGLDIKIETHPNAPKVPGNANEQNPGQGQEASAAGAPNPEAPPTGLVSQEQIQVSNPPGDTNSMNPSDSSNVPDIPGPNIIHLNIKTENEQHPDGGLSPKSGRRRDLKNAAPADPGAAAGSADNAAAGGSDNEADNQIVHVVTIQQVPIVPKWLRITLAALCGLIFFLIIVWVAVHSSQSKKPDQDGADEPLTNMDDEGSEIASAKEDYGSVSGSYDTSTGTGGTEGSGSSSSKS